MHLGLSLLGTGSHVAGWLMPGAVDSFQDIDAIQRIAADAAACIRTMRALLEATSGLVPSAGGR